MNNPEEPSGGRYSFTTPSQSFSLATAGEKLRQDVVKG
jgi:hypothetical protein